MNERLFRPEALRHYQRGHEETVLPALPRQRGLVWLWAGAVLLTAAAVAVWSGVLTLLGK